MHSLVIIQALTTQWTKRSRGSEKASLRNKTPESLPLPSWLLEKDTGCLRHTVAFAESAKFEARELVELDFKPVGVDVVCLKQPEPTWENSQTGCVHVLHHEGQLKVSFIGSEAGAPNRDNQLAFRLCHGEWGRIISNGRFSSWEDGPLVV